MCWKVLAKLEGKILLKKKEKEKKRRRKRKLYLKIHQNIS